MITLIKTVDFLKKYAWVFAASVAIIVLIVILTFKYLLAQKSQAKPPTPPSISVNFDTQTSAFNFDNLKPPSKAPKQLPAYDARFVDLLEHAETAAGNLGINQKAQELNDKSFGKGMAFATDKESLTIYKDELSYSRYGQRQSEGIFKNPEDLKIIAHDFILKLGLNTDLFQNYTTSYFISPEEFMLKTDDPDKATLAVIVFQPEISGYRLILPRSEVSATFDKKNSLVGLIYKYPNIGNPTDKYPIISLQEAKAYLATGKAPLIKIAAQDNFASPPQNLETVNIQDAYIAYYLSSEDTSVIQPIWAFEGKVQTENGEIELLYAVPAIKN